MGCSICCNEDSVKEKINENKIIPEQNIIINDPGPDPNFPDMEEWDGERYSGVGVKKMKGYKCNLPIDELNEKRRIFWDTKINENKDWEIIAKICISDEERIKIALNENNFILKGNCINHIIGPTGTHFHVPNYCINDPYFEKELIKSDVEEKKIKINLIEKANNINIKEEFSNHDSGEKLKKVFIDKTKINKNEYKLKLFFSGTEIKDNEFIYQHNLKEEDNIIIFQIKL